MASSAASKAANFTRVRPLFRDKFGRHGHAGRSAPAAWCTRPKKGFDPFMRFLRLSACSPNRRSEMKCLLAMLLALASAHAAAVGGMADLTVYDRQEGRPLQVYWHEGRAWVVGRPGNEYQLNVRSRQGEELLAVLSVDGVNVITGETASPQQSGYVLAPGRALEVKGWRKDLSRTAAFYFTPLADSYAARTGRPDHVGAIGVALFRKKRPEPVPYSQIAPAAPQAKAESSDRNDAAGSGAGSLARSAEAPLGTG